MTELRYGNGHVPLCPLRNEPCVIECAWLMVDDHGNFLCPVPMLVMSDCFGPTLMNEVERDSDDI
jgi:hypothetical protein